MIDCVQEKPNPQIERLIEKITREDDCHNPIESSCYVLSHVR